MTEPRNLRLPEQGSHINAPTEPGLRPGSPDHSATTPVDGNKHYRYADPKRSIVRQATEVTVR